MYTPPPPALNSNKALLFFLDSYLDFQYSKELIWTKILLAETLYSVNISCMEVCAQILLIADRVSATCKVSVLS